MAKERATEKSEKKKSKDKKLSADKVKKSSKSKEEKKERKAKKIAKLEEELEYKPKVEEQVTAQDVEAEDVAMDDSPVNQEEKEPTHNTPAAAEDENQEESKKSKKKKSDKKHAKKSDSEEVTESPTKSAKVEGDGEDKKDGKEERDGEDAAEKKGKSEKKKKKNKGAEPSQPHLSGLNRAARRRLQLIERQRAKIEKSLGPDRKDEVEKEVEKWTKTFDERQRRSAEKKAMKAKFALKRRVEKTQKRKELGLSKKQFDKLKLKEKKAKTGNAGNAAPVAA
ncbi:hypothetical protein V8F20_002011 [Naviculisporaceae sp. PSN 640]